MTTKMLINAVDAEEFRIAFVKDGFLDGFHIETSTSEQKRGNIYRGVVEKVVSSLQACFVDLGTERNGFLQSGEIHPEYYQDPTVVGKEQGSPPIDKIVKKGQELLVQVTRDMPGQKGPQLTTYLSMAGRYLVLTPGNTTGGVSRKIEDEEERQRLKTIMGQSRLPEGVGFIVRTAARGQSKRDLSMDLNRLLRLWKSIRESVKKAQPLSLVYKEQDICLRTLRDYFTGDVTEVVVDDKDTYGKVRDYMKIISPRHQRNVKLYKGKQPIFDHYDVEKQIEAVYSSQVQLKSGGYLVIDQTEALIAIDVNSGRRKGGKDVEETAYQTNLEAASEIARQLRLRDIGGLVVIDFIDMRERKHIKGIEKTLKEKTRLDRAKMDMSSISKFGLMELSRERLAPSLESRSYQMCAVCQGRGIVQSIESSAVSFFRQMWMGVSKGGIIQVKGVFPPAVANYLQNKKRKELAHLESRYGVEIGIQGDLALPIGSGRLEFVTEAPVNEKHPAPIPKDVV
jgi:ribonuclease E